MAPTPDTRARIRFPDGQMLSYARLEQDPERGQLLLERHRGAYPRCLCRPSAEDPPALYIARRGPTHYLARMPGTGPDHAPDCPHYEPDPNTTGLACYKAGALRETDDGRARVRISIRLKEPPPPAVTDGEGEDGQADADGEGEDGEGQADAEGEAGADDQPAATRRASFALDGLLDLVYDRARFNRWYPRMAGRRGYRQLHKFCEEAASQLTLQRLPLTRRLYLPEPFRPADKDDIRERREIRFRDIFAQGRRGFVLGLIKRVEETPHGLAITLKHLGPEVVFTVPADKRDQWNTLMGEGMQLVPGPDGHLPAEAASRLADGHALCLLLVHRPTPGMFYVRGFALRWLTAELLPYEHDSQGRLVSELVGAERAFLVPLRFDAGPETVLPGAVLLDAGEAPVSLWLDEAPHEAGDEAWVWRAGDDEPPALPAKASR